MRDAQKLAKALSETETSEADIFMASVLLKFRGLKQAQSFVNGLLLYNVSSTVASQAKQS